MECEVCASPLPSPIDHNKSQLLQAIDIIHPETQVATTTMILGNVKYIHVRKDVLNERGNVDPAKLKPMGRMGDITYARSTEGFRLERPSWHVKH